MIPATTGNAGLHVRYEKAGLILDALPVPFNADAVIVEANVRLPKKTPRVKSDFTLRWSVDEPGIAAELLVEQTPKKPMRVFFRVPRPKGTAIATVHWRDHLLGQIEVPILGMSSLVNGFTIEMPTLYVALGDSTIACQAFVSAQAKSVIASAILRAPCLLAPVNDLGLRVQLKREDREEIDMIRIALTPEQMSKRQALVTVQLPKPRTIDRYEVSWWIASRCLHLQRFRTISKKTLLRSLRITSARFQLEMTDGTFHTVRVMPTNEGRLALNSVARVSPRFFVCSDEAGLAGIVPFTLRSLANETIKTLAIEEDVLVTDGPRSIGFAPQPVDGLANVQHFTLATGDTVLGNLALLPAPSASFNAEGGFAPLDDFLWSPAADELLKDRLGKLLDED
jgi:hypothetical protein